MHLVLNALHDVVYRLSCDDLTSARVLFFEEGLGVCALKQLISPVNMLFYSDVRIWLEGAAVATPPICIIGKCT